MVESFPAEISRTLAYEPRGEGMDPCALLYEMIRRDCCWFGVRKQVSADKRELFLILSVENAVDLDYERGRVRIKERFS